MVYDSEKVTASKIIESVNVPYGKGARDLWKHKYCQKDVSGSGNYLWSVLKPVGEFDFYHKFINYAEENKSKPIAWRGLTHDELTRLAESFKADFEVDAKCDYPVETYYNYMLLHLIQEPFNGHRKEIEMLEYLLSRGKPARLADGELDLKYKVDILVGDYTGFIQVSHGIRNHLRMHAQVLLVHQGFHRSLATIDKIFHLLARFAHDGGGFGLYLIIAGAVILVVLVFSAIREKQGRQ